MASVKDYEQSLIRRFVDSFEKLDEMLVFPDTDPVAAQLAFGDPDQYGFRRWKPVEIVTQPSLLEPIYSKLPARFPHLYECLILSWRWAQVDLQSVTLLSNPPGPDLSGYLHQISKDKALWNCLRHTGFMQFGKGADMDYDPVCFDISSRKKKGTDFRIVKIDHEEILCNDRIKIVEELAPSFEKLALNVIEKANLT